MKVARRCPTPIRAILATPPAKRTPEPSTRTGHSMCSASRPTRELAALPPPRMVYAAAPELPAGRQPQAGRDAARGPRAEARRHPQARRHGRTRRGLVLAEAEQRVRSAEDGTRRRLAARRSAKWLTSTRQPADLARDGQSRLAVPLRPRTRRHAQRLRQDGPASRRTPSCSTGSRPSFREQRLAQETAPHDRHERDLQAIVAPRAGRPEGRRGQQTALAAEPHAARRGGGPRRDPRRQRPARSDHGRPVGHAVRHEARAST